MTNLSKLLTIMAIAAIYAGCKIEKIEPVSIVGKWTVDKVVVDDYTINDIPFMDFYVNNVGLTTEEAQEFYDSHVGDASRSGSFEFTEDGNYTEIWGDVSLSDTYTLDDNILVLDDSNYFYDVYSFDTKVDVVSLTETELVLSGVRKSMGFIDDDDQWDNIVMKITMTLSR